MPDFVNSPAEACGPPPVAIPPDIIPLGDRPVDEAEAAQLDDIFSAVAIARTAITPGPDAGAQQRAIEYELRGELFSFVTNHLESAWAPGVLLWLGRVAELRCNYSEALDHYEWVWAALRASGPPRTRPLK